LDFDFKKRDLVVGGVEFLGEIQGAVRSGRARPLDGGWAVMMGRRRWWRHRRGHGFCCFFFSFFFFELLFYRVFCSIWFE
jgi:hypothetical protein